MIDIDVASLPFVTLEDRRQIPQESAVYFVIDQTDEVIYVGRSVDIRQRWKGHHLMPALAGYEGVRIAWVLPPQTMRLADFESALIVQLRPRLNVVGVPSDEPARVPVLMKFDAADLDAIDDYRFRHRWKSRSAAMRFLLDYGLQYSATPPPDRT